MAPSQLGGCGPSSPAHAPPNVEFHVQPLSLDAFGERLAKALNINKDHAPAKAGFTRIGGKLGQSYQTF